MSIMKDQNQACKNCKSRFENTGKGSVIIEIVSRIKHLFPCKHEEKLREALEEYIAEPGSHSTQTISAHERNLIANVLKLRDKNVVDVMIPRADIVSIDVNISRQELMLLLAEKQYSRLPVCGESLDDILGTIHIKDILSQLATEKPLIIRDLVRDVPIVSPAMPVLDLLLHMRKSRKHMVLVVDEFGGIDGLVTIGDLIEAIVGELEDEFDTDIQPEIEESSDGSLYADARFDIDDFENKYGQILNEEERSDIDTLGGLVFSLAGRIPARGEVITHENGMVFEVLDADPRRIKRLRIRGLGEQAGQ
jgi:CBS domain containing-hemolysin-like protein